MKIDVIKPGDTNARVYHFGVRVDMDCRPKLKEQFDLAHRTYNEIVAKIRDIDKNAREWLQQMAGERAAELWLLIESLNSQWDEAKAVDDREMLKKVAEERRGCWREWYQLLHESRRKHSSELKLGFMDQIGERTTCPTYQIRCDAVAQGLGWATANAVLKAAIQAHKKQWPKFKQPNFRKIAEVPQKVLELQFTAKGGIGVDNLFGGKSSEIAISNGNTGRRAYQGFRMRVGSGESRADITGTVALHRAIPPEGRIKYARLVERRIGKDLRHYLQFVVTDLTIDKEDQFPHSDTSMAALDFGWYYEEHGRRIAGFADSRDPDRAEVLRLPLEVDGLFERSEHHKSQRDHLRDELVAELKAIPAEEIAALPELISQDLVTIRRLPAQHVASSRLARLTLDWREFDGPAYPLYARLESWRKQDKLLWQAESHLAFHARNLRKKHYEKLSLSWARRYRAIVIDTPELSETAKVKDKTTGKHNPLGGVARSGRVRAALYELEQSIVKAAANYGVAVAKITGRTSKTCSLCGGNALPEKEGGREVICHGCGAIIDREANAAAVVWQQGQAGFTSILDKFGDKKLELAEQIATRTSRKNARQEALVKSARTRRDLKNAGGFAEPQHVENTGE